MKAKNDKNRRTKDNTTSYKGVDDTTSFLPFTTKKEKIITTPAKVKIKKRGTPSVQETEKSQENIQNQREIEPIAIESLVGKNPYDIFCKIFTCYFNNTTDQHVKISLTEVKTLMKALNTKTSSAKGSHKKITFVPEKIGIFESDKAINSVLILANHTFLLPYQIKSLRACFLSYNLYPIELGKFLKDKGLMNSCF